MKYYKFIILSLIFVFISICIALIWGDYSISQILKVLTFNTDNLINTTLPTIIWSMRIPRILVSLIIGAALASSGVVFQGILRNSLAEPYTLGVSGGASLGVCIAQILNFSFLFFPFAAFIGAMCAIYFVYIIFIRGRFSVYKLILTGIMISLISSSLVFLILSVLDRRDIGSVLMWLMGNIPSLSYNYIAFLYIFVFLGLISLIIMGRDLDILTLGEEKAHQLGVNVKFSVKILFIITSIIVGLCVAYTGIIGFVGLIIPHIVRSIIGPKHRRLILASALFGAGYLCIADTIAKRIIYPMELPVGVITGVLGGIFLIIILFRKGAEI